jgi:hypothetical protein
MRKIIWLVCLISLVLAAEGQSQSEKKIGKLFMKAQQQIEDSLCAEAIETYKQILKMTTDQSTAFSKATYNTGYTYMLLKNDDAAKEIFLDILNGDFNEMDKGGRGFGIMAEPYALYKHNSCENLASIEMRNGDYQAALTYIEMFDKEYPYRHFCGNEMAAFENYKAVMYAKAWCGLKDTLKAIHYLLPYVFYNGLASNRQVVDNIVQLLTAKYSKAFLASELKKAIENLSSKVIHEGNYRHTVYTIAFLGTGIEVPYEYFEPKDTREYAGKTELEKRKLSVVDSDFYQRLTR